MTAVSQTRVYRVPEMTCDHCRNAIESNVGPLDGVVDVQVDLEAKTVTVVGGDDPAISAAIDDAGFDIAT
jgi:copper chaperone